MRTIFDTLANARPAGESYIAQTLLELAERLRQRSMVVIISDLLTELPELLDAFKHLKFYKHDLAVFHLLDKQEMDFDFSRPVRFVDMESGADLITDPTVVRDAYLEAVRDYMDTLGHGCREFGVDYHKTYLHQSFEGVMGDFLLQRLRKKKGAGR